MVKTTGRVALDLGKTFNKAGELRLAADYEGDPIEPTARHELIAGPNRGNTANQTGLAALPAPAERQR